MCCNEYRLPNMSDVDPDQMLICPFDRVHRISAKRFPYHIVKCQKNHLTAKVTFCPFNARHIIQGSEFAHHVANCPDKSTIEPDMAYAEAQRDGDGTYMKGDTSVPSYHHDSFPMSTENWDLEETPQEKLVQQAESERLHTVTGMTQSQRSELNRKLLEVHNSNSLSTNFEDNEEQGESSEQEVEEIRLPKQLPRAGGPAQLQHNGILKSAGQSVPHGPIGLGRAMLVPGRQTAISRQGTTVQGRSIAANIFNTQTNQQQPREETQSRHTPTMTMPVPRSVNPCVARAKPQDELCSTPAAVPNLAGLGRGLGIPRGGYRPGLGMPAVGSFSTVKQ